jgi:hypothetical protein
MCISEPSSVEEDTVYDEEFSHDKVDGAHIWLYSDTHTHKQTIKHTHTHISLNNTLMYMYMYIYSASPALNPKPQTPNPVHTVGGHAGLMQKLDKHLVSSALGKPQVRRYQVHLLHHLSKSYNPLFDHFHHYFLEVDLQVDYYLILLLD